MPEVLEHSIVEEPFLKPFGEKAFSFAFRDPRLDKRFTVLEGAVRSAKTWALHPKVLQLCEYPIKGLRLFTGVTKSSIKNNVLNDLFEIVGRDNYSYNGQSGEIDLYGTKWLAVGAKDEGSEKIIRGSTVGINVGDELTLQAVSFWKMVQNRMSVEGARSYWTTNPDTPFHPVYTDLINNEALLTRGELEHIHFEIADNPNLPDWYEGYLNSIYPPGSLYHQRFVLGLWVTGEGAILKDVWGEHLLYDDVPWTMKNGKPGMVTPIGLKGSRPTRSISIDCGVDHVQVYLDWLDDGKDLWCDHEYWWDSHVTGRQKTDRQYREDLEKFKKECGAESACVLLPPECASFAAELSQAGIWFKDADNEVLDGIRMMCSLMALGRVHFHRRRTKNTQMQLQAYMWDPKAAKRGVEQPLKQKDDGCDAVRYFIKTEIQPWRLYAAA